MAYALTARPASGPRNLTAGIITAWFFLAFGASLLGVFDSQPRPPFALGLAASVPIALFAICYRTSAGFRQFASSLDVRLLTVAQTGRAVGIVFVILYYQGALPGVFALPAGWGDFAIGVTAPVVAWYWKPPFPRKTLIAWNLLGILDLVLAVSLGVLASQSAVGLLAGDVSTQLMGQFPLSLIPTFFVPLFVIFHLITLSRVGKEV
jgi:hypothetical protein